MYSFSVFFYMNRYLVEGVEEDFVEHLVIDEDEQHHFTIEGQVRVDVPCSQSSSY